MLPMFSMEGRAKDWCLAFALLGLCFAAHIFIKKLYWPRPHRLTFDLASLPHVMKQLQNFSGKKQEKEEHLGGH